MKRARQAEILNIIQAVDVETQEQLLDELQNWSYTYADPAVDGTREGVTGFGQMRRPGIHSEGKPVYATSPKYQKA